MEKFEQKGNKVEQEKIANFQEFIGEVEKMVDNQINSEKEIEEDLTKKAKVRNGIMNKIWYTITHFILNKFKVKITLYYNDKVVFEYEIPKN